MAGAKFGLEVIARGGAAANTLRLWRGKDAGPIDVSIDFDGFVQVIMKISTVLDWFKTGLRTAKTFVKQITDLKSLASGLLATVDGALKAADQMVAELGAQAQAMIKTGAALVNRTAQNIANQAVEAVDTVVTTAQAAVNGAINSTRNAVNGAKTNVPADVNDVFSQSLAKTEELWTQLMAAIGGLNLAPPSSGKASEAVDTFGGLSGMESALKDLVTYARAVLGDESELLAALPAPIRTLWTSDANPIYKKLTEMLSTADAYLKDETESLATRVRNQLTGLVLNAKSEAQAMFADLASKLDGAVQSTVGALQTQLKSTRRVVGDLAGYLTKVDKILVTAMSALMTVESTVASIESKAILRLRKLLTKMSGGFSAKVVKKVTVLGGRFSGTMYALGAISFDINTQTKIATAKADLRVGLDYATKAGMKGNVVEVAFTPALSAAATIEMQTDGAGGANVLPTKVQVDAEITGLIPTLSVLGSPPMPVTTNPQELISTVVPELINTVIELLKAEILPAVTKRAMKLFSGALTDPDMLGGMFRRPADGWLKSIKSLEGYCPSMAAVAEQTLKNGAQMAATVVDDQAARLGLPSIDLQSSLSSNEDNTFGDTQNDVNDVMRFHSVGRAALRTPATSTEKIGSLVPLKYRGVYSKASKILKINTWCDPSQSGSLPSFADVIAAPLSILSAVDNQAEGAQDMIVRLLGAYGISIPPGLIAVAKSGAASLAMNFAPEALKTLLKEAQRASAGGSLDFGTDLKALTGDDDVSEAVKRPFQLELRQMRKMAQSFVAAQAQSLDPTVALLLNQIMPPESAFPASWADALDVSADQIAQEPKSGARWPSARRTR